MKAKLLFMAVLYLILLTAPVAVSTCMAQQADQSVDQQPEAQQRVPVEDPIRELNLSPAQRAQIREIRQQLQGERAVINQRLRETNQALTTALEAESPDESLIEQRLRDLAAAQAAQMRMRVLSEVRIRRVLTPEQRVLLRELRQANEFRRRENQRRENPLPRGLRNQRNTLAPLAPVAPRPGANTPRP
jgi:Spy/CpxP family protein refolding chaperone